MTASIFWVLPDGALTDQLATVSILADRAVYSGPPLPAGRQWALTVNLEAGPPIFRSGPLHALPGASLPRAADRIEILYNGGLGSMDLYDADGAPEIALQALQHLPPGLEGVSIDHLIYRGDGLDNEVLTAHGRLQMHALWKSFTFSRTVKLRPQTHPGLPKSIALFDAVAPDVATGAPLGAERAALLSSAMGAAILLQMDYALQRIAGLQNESYHSSIPAQFVTATHLHITGGSEPSIVFTVHGGGLVHTISENAPL